MSTASRDCGTACGPRAGDSNAVSVPGASGKTRGHYDPRAARQLGSPSDWTEPKSESELERVRAAPGDRAFAPTHYTGLREPRLRHSPPVFFPRPPPAKSRQRRSGFAVAFLVTASPGVPQ